jgi:hypothetical protein
MELLIKRSYYAEGTNGELFIDGQHKCYTIELPWHNNDHGISCIPEGRYHLGKRANAKFGNHLLVENVPNRSYILIHPANDALKELLGCIAPVSVLTGPGRGERSRIQLDDIVRATYASMSKGEDVFLTIEKAQQHGQQ